MTNQEYYKHSLEICDAWIELAEKLCQEWTDKDFSIKKIIIQIFIRQLKELKG